VKLVAPKNPLDESKKELAKQCKKELGYPVLSQTIERDKNKTKLEQCMDRVGLRPFTRETIEKYKKEEANRRWYEYNAADFKITATVAAVLASFYCSWFIMYFCSGAWIAIPVIFSILGALGFGFLLTVALPDIFRVRAEWLTDHLSVYKKPIPEYALETALGLQKELKAEGIDSECKFYVESLFIHKEARDPFLFVQCGNFNRYYLEVWDEPNFGVEKLV